MFLFDINTKNVQ